MPEITMTYAELGDERHAAFRALRGILNVLGPEKVCNCDHTCGLPEEAAEALRIARECLAAHDELPAP